MSAAQRVDTIAVLLWIAQDNRCFYCKVPFSGPKNQKQPLYRQWSRDHLFPRSEGHGLERNTVLACLRCNQGKGDRLPTPREQMRAYQLWETVDRLGPLLFGRTWAWGGRKSCPQPAEPITLLGDVLTIGPQDGRVINGHPQGED